MTNWAAIAQVLNLLATIFTRAYYSKGWWNGCQESLLTSSISERSSGPDWKMFLPSFSQNVFGEAGAYEGLINPSAVRGCVLVFYLRV